MAATKDARLRLRLRPRVAKKEFKAYEIGFFHIDSAQINLGEGLKY
jgi:hypothetical protein